MASFVWGGPTATKAATGGKPADAELAALFAGGTNGALSSGVMKRGIPQVEAATATTIPQASSSATKSKRRRIQVADDEAEDANLDWMGAAFGKGAGVESSMAMGGFVDPLKVGNHEVRVFGLGRKTKKGHVRAAFTEYGDIRGVRFVVRLACILHYHRVLVNAGALKSFFASSLNNSRVARHQSLTSCQCPLFPLCSSPLPPIHCKATSGSDHLTAVVTYGSKVEADGAARNATGTEIRGNVVRAELVSGVEGAVAGTDNPASKAPPVSGEHDGSALVMVSGLGDRATDGGLRNHFAACGKIRAVQVALDKKTGEAKGFAYILFRKPAGAHAALALHKVDYAGSIARVALSSSARQIQRMIKMDGPPPNAVPKPREEDDDAGRANCDKGERILPNKKNGKGRSEKHEGTKGKPAKKRSSKKPRNET
jgi:hypothetical protein